LIPLSRVSRVCSYLNYTVPFNSNPAWEGLSNLVIVACHAVYTAQDFFAPESDASWALQEFQKGEPPAYIQHIEAGVQRAFEDPSTLLIFSGGQTRVDAGPKSEAQGYWMLAEHARWWNLPVKHRVSTEEFARDSFENLLFGICRFFECVQEYPDRVTVVSWAFKAERFDLHREAIHLPVARFEFVGVNNPDDLQAALEGERRYGVHPFMSDPYGTNPVSALSEPTAVNLAAKRIARNPFRRHAPYELSCPHLAGLLRHRGPALFAGDLPWS
jgi:hypothetical protein